MDQPAGSSGESEEAKAALQFDHAEPTATAQATPCVLCKKDLEGEYFEISGKVTCPSCKVAVDASLAKAAKGAFSRAALFGAGAALLGSIVFYAAEAITGYQIGLVAIGVGFLVGVAVRRGSANRGGRKFQILAVALTYLSIASSNVPAIVEGVRTVARKQASTSTSASPSPSPSASASSPAKPEAQAALKPKPMPTLLAIAILFAFLAWMLLASPFYGGFMGLVILAIALYEAWKLTRGVALVVRGPYRIRA